MSVRERIEDLEEEMDELFQRKVEIRTLREWLAEDGYLPPDNPSDVSTELCTLLDYLGSLNLMVEFADHLSDRELYAWLSEQINAHIALIPGTSLYFDVIGGGSDEDNEAYLTYYASDEEREQWKADFPNEKLPQRKRPLYNRRTIK
jgi:hypothetical protein